MIEITEQMVRDLLPEAVATRGAGHVSPLFLPTGLASGPGALSATEDPDRKYGSMCRYVAPDGESPQCIVGTILHLAGVPLETLSNHEGKGSWDLMEKLLVTGVARVSDNARNLLSDLQGSQDSGMTWGALLDN